MQNPTHGRPGLAGRVAVVTGAASGMGRGVALDLARAGVRVAAFDRDEAGLASLVVEAEGGAIMPFVADVSDFDDIAARVADVQTAWGAPEILVTAAGVDAVQELSTMTPEQWRSMIAVNLDGTFFPLRACVDGMKHSGWGRVVMFGSNVVSEGVIGKTHYGAAKGGVHALARSAARELAPFGITVNVVAPGLVETPMVESLDPGVRETLIAQIPAGRFGRVEEIVPIVGLLCSDDGAYMTGATFNVSGGRVMP